MPRTKVSRVKVPVSDKPGRILIIDDQEENVKLLERILGNAGYEDVASTTNSVDAHRLLTQFKPDLRFWKKSSSTPAEQSMFPCS